MTALLLAMVLASPTFAPPSTKLQTQTVEQFLEVVQRRMQTDTPPKFTTLFKNPKQSGPFLEMASRRGGIFKLKVAALRAPSGWNEHGPYWIHFFTRQEVEADQDAVFGLNLSESGWSIGAPVKLDSAKNLIQFKPVSAKVAILEDESAVISGVFDFVVPIGTNAANLRVPILRLGSQYQLATGAGQTFEPGQVAKDFSRGWVRVGGLIFRDKPIAEKGVSLNYSGSFKSSDEDTIEKDRAYLTADWFPHFERMPTSFPVEVTAPTGWKVWSEGPTASPANFKSIFPISFPKVVAGKYLLGDELKQDGKVFRSFILDPKLKETSKSWNQSSAAAVKWCEENLGPFPYPGYDVLESKGFYGIESYSYTLLQPAIMQYISHEIIHTYFGGIVPCRYLQDSWNESVTQYVDSVVYKNNQDRTLEAGLRVMDVKKPLSEMAVPHADKGASYWKGAYVMKMLENEIGREAVFVGLRDLLKVRAGKDTVWSDLLPSFERASGTKLGWFWNQWIYSAKFPEVKLLEARAVQREKTFRTWVRIGQVADVPYRLKVKIIARKGTQEKVFTPRVEGAFFTLPLDTDFRPDTITLDLFGFAYGKGGNMVPVRN